MNTQERIMNMTPEQFEQECVNLLRYMKPKHYKIVGTRYVKDGGKDIRATVDNVPYEIWAECKKHKRSLGLDDISKMLYLLYPTKLMSFVFFDFRYYSKCSKKYKHRCGKIWFFSFLSLW